MNDAAVNDRTNQCRVTERFEVSLLASMRFRDLNSARTSLSES